jgi:S-formylglutathione hydrolase FrmB
MNVITPENRKNNNKVNIRAASHPYPVLYLLHGLSDDHTSWQRKTSIERYANKYGLAVVMPNVHRSFYTDMECGNDYFTFVSQELPEIVTKLFPISTERKNTFVAGLSMGGYGAFKLALNKPEYFAAAASLSGIVNIDIAAKPENFEEEKKLHQEFEWIFGDLKNIKNTNNDLFYLLQKLKKAKSKIPVLYQCCGKNDFLYQNNLDFRNFCTKNNIKLKYEEEENTAHEWEYWDKKILDVIRWLSFY